MNKPEIPQPPKPFRNSRQSVKMKAPIDDCEQAAMEKGYGETPKAPKPAQEVLEPASEVVQEVVPGCGSCCEQATLECAPAIECPTCGFVYREDIDIDCVFHQHVCEQVQAFAAMYDDFPSHPNKIEEQFARGFALMNEHDLEQRVHGAQLVSKACFARSLISMLMNVINSEIEHGSFDEYQRALIANELQVSHLFPIKLTEVLAHRYGAKSSKHLLIGSTHWTNW